MKFYKVDTLIKRNIISDSIIVIFCAPNSIPGSTIWLNDNLKGISSGNIFHKIKGNLPKDDRFSTAFYAAEIPNRKYGTFRELCTSIKYRDITMYFSYCASDTKLSAAFYADVPDIGAILSEKVFKDNAQFTHAIVLKKWAEVADLHLEGGSPLLWKELIEDDKETKDYLYNRSGGINAVAVFRLLAEIKFYSCNTAEGKREFEFDHMNYFNMELFKAEGQI